MVPKREGLNMLGLKIAATGVLVMLVSGLCIQTIGKWPGTAKGVPLVALWFSGATAVVAGAVMAIWA